MAVVKLEPLVEPPYATVTMNQREFKAVMAVLGALGGGYGKPYYLANTLIEHDKDGHLRDDLASMWYAMTKAVAE